MTGREQAWIAWRAVQPELDDRDVGAESAFGAGYAAGHADTVTHTPWHTSLAAVLIVLGILAAICYVLTST